jgi:putative membrane protein
MFDARGLGGGSPGSVAARPSECSRWTRAPTFAYRWRVLSRTERIAPAVFMVGLVYTGWAPVDRFTWWLEVAPALIALVVLAATYRQFPLSGLTYALIVLHCWVLMIGGKWTYAENPVFEWLKEPLGWERNNYDKLDHLMQGFVPVIVTREVLLRLRVVRGRAWLNVVAVSMCLALSAIYELVEWWVSVATGESVDAFLGTQGYTWDTQSDMLMCWVGAVLGLLLLSRLSDRSIAQISSAPAALETG